MKNCYQKIPKEGVEMNEMGEDILQKVQRIREADGTGGRWGPAPNQDITPDEVYELITRRSGIKPAEDENSS